MSSNILRRSLRGKKGGECSPDLVTDTSANSPNESENSFSAWRSVGSVSPASPFSMTESPFQFPSLGTPYTAARNCPSSEDSGGLSPRARALSPGALSPCIQATPIPHDGYIVTEADRAVTPDSELDAKHSDDKECSFTPQHTKTSHLSTTTTPSIIINTTTILIQSVLKHLESLDFSFLAAKSISPTLSRPQAWLMLIMGSLSILLGIWLQCQAVATTCNISINTRTEQYQVAIRHSANIGGVRLSRAIPVVGNDRKGSYPNPPVYTTSTQSAVIVPLHAAYPRINAISEYRYTVPHTVTIIPTYFLRGYHYTGISHAGTPSPMLPRHAASKSVSSGVNSGNSASMQASVPVLPVPVKSIGTPAATGSTLNTGMSPPPSRTRSTREKLRAILTPPVAINTAPTSTATARNTEQDSVYPLKLPILPRKRSASTPTPLISHTPALPVRSARSLASLSLIAASVTTPTSTPALYIPTPLSELALVQSNPYERTNRNEKEHDFFVENPNEKGVYVLHSQLVGQPLARTTTTWVEGTAPASGKLHTAAETVGDQEPKWQSRIEMPVLLTPLQLLQVQARLLAAMTVAMNLLHVLGHTLLKKLTQVRIPDLISAISYVKNIPKSVISHKRVWQRKLDECIEVMVIEGGRLVMQIIGPETLKAIASSKVIEQV